MKLSIQLLRNVTFDNDWADSTCFVNIAYLVTTDYGKSWLVICDDEEQQWWAYEIMPTHGQVLTVYGTNGTIEPFEKLEDFLATFY